MKKVIKRKRFWLKAWLAVFTALIVSVNQPPPLHSVVPDKKDSGRPAQTGSNAAQIEFRYVPGEVLVKFKNGVTEAQKNQYHAEADVEVLSEIPALGMQKVRSKRAESTEALIARYKKNPFVEYAEPNGIFHTALTPNDPSFSQLWGLNNTGQSVGGTTGTPGADIHAPAAWDLQTGSATVIVADIDTGVNYTHPDLAANIWTNPGEIPGDGIDNDGNGFIDDVYGWDFSQCARFRSNGTCQIPKPRGPNPMDNNGHGTHTSGTIAATGDNAIGVVGVNWRAKILSVKWLNADGEGTFADAAAAILYASQMGARVSNNSWACEGSPGCFSQTVENAINTAYQLSMLFVVAAGNGGADGIGDNNDTSTTYPCNSNIANVICVAATTQNDNRASFSNYGALNVDLGAPGVNILSTVLNSGYAIFNGTSMATPHVAGAAALLLAQNPSLTTTQLRSILLNSVDPIPSLSGITVTGGRLNVFKALQSISTTTTTTTTSTTSTTTTTTSTTTTTTTTIPNQPPSANSLTPVNLSTEPGAAQSFTASYSDPDGWQNISDASLLLSGVAHNELMHYNPATDKFTLMGAGGDCSPGQMTTLANAFMTINCVSSSVSSFGTMLMVTYNLTPQAPLSGAPYLLIIGVVDQGGLSNNKTTGSWIVNRRPSADSVSPMNSITSPGTPQTFTVALSDPDGWENIVVANLYLAGGLHNEWLHYLAAPNLFTMLGTNDICIPGQATTLSNGFLTLDCGASSVSGTGTTMTVIFRVTPELPSSGMQYNIFTAANDNADASHAILAGTWTVQ